MSRPGCSWACSSLPSALDVLAEVVGEGELVQRAADDGLRLVALGHDHGRQAVLAGGDPAVAADEVDVVRPLHQELGHDRRCCRRSRERWQSVHCLVSLRPGR